MLIFKINHPIPTPRQRQTRTSPQHMKQAIMHQTPQRYNKIKLGDAAHSSAQISRSVVAQRRGSVSDWVRRVSGEAPLIYDFGSSIDCLDDNLLKKSKYLDPFEIKRIEEKESIHTRRQQ
jgi:hypothetical protein